MTEKSFEFDDQCFHFLFKRLSCSKGTLHKQKYADTKLYFSNGWIARYGMPDQGCQLELSLFLRLTAICDSRRITTYIVYGMVVHLHCQIKAA